MSLKGVKVGTKVAQGVEELGGSGGRETRRRSLPREASGKWDRCVWRVIDQRKPINDLFSYRSEMMTKLDLLPKEGGRVGMGKKRHPQPFCVTHGQGCRFMENKAGRAQRPRPSVTGKSFPPRADTGASLVPWLVCETSAQEWFVIFSDFCLLHIAPN